jgi:hypothetical protein
VPVGIVVQNDAGDQAGANSYLSVSAFKAYHDLRGNSYSAYTDDQIASSLIRATDYVDGRFSFPGQPTNGTDQTTKWPRLYVSIPDSSSEYAGIPEALERAIAEYALRALSAPLLQDAPAPDGGRAIRRQRDVVDVIETEVEYEPGGVVSVPSYPVADNQLRSAGLILDVSGRFVTR